MVLETTCGTEFIIDDSDYNKIKHLNFYKHTISYKENEWVYIKCSNGKLLHRIIMDCPPKKHIDHINSNGLDNRRCNIRICNRNQNQGNRNPSNKTSKYKGVSRSKSKYKNMRWRAQITKNGKCYNLGRYPTEIEAAEAYDKKAIELHGEFAKTNKDLELI